MVPLQLTLFGGFAAGCGLDHLVRISSRKNQALLAFLALQPGRRHAREQLADLLWSEGEQGRNSLRQALTALRKDLASVEPFPVAVEGEALSVPEGAVEVDVIAFERHARSDDIDDLKIAAALYRGDLLAGLALGASDFMEWLAPERSRLRELAIDLYLRLIPRLGGAEALAAAERLVALDPLRDTGQRLLMALLAEQGESDLGLRQYRDYAEALKRELGLQPSPAIQALQKQIASGAFPIPEQSPRKDSARAPRFGVKHSVAVLPFENRGADPAQQALCDLLSGEIADDLSRIANAHVIAGAATEHYRGAAVDVRGIGADLGVGYVMQGSIHRLGDRLRASAQLCETVRGHYIWADQYDCGNAEFPDLQETIAKAIAASSETRMTLAGRDRVPRAAPETLSFHDLLARGFSLLYDEQPDSLLEVLALAERAVALQPVEPRAHELLGYAFVQRIAARAVDFDPALAARGVELARAFARMAPANEWSHLLLARARIETGDLEAALADCERALEINPSAAFAHARRGECYALLGRSAEALQAIAAAQQLDPRAPERYRRDFTIALAHFAAGDDAAAYGEAGRAARWRPDYTRADLLLAAVAMALGHRSEAAAALARCRLRYPDLRADAVMPRVMPAFARAADRARLTRMLVEAGLPNGPSGAVA